MVKYEHQAILIFIAKIVFINYSEGQDCESGSFYDDLNSNAVSSIDRGYWYLNLDKPCSCSGEVEMYVVKNYTLENADYNVYAAMWELMEDGKYHIMVRN